MKKQIRGIVWDVGRVLLDIDIHRGVEILAEQYGHPFDAVWEFVTASPEFHEFERGARFYDEFVTACNTRFRGNIDTAAFARIMEGQLIGPKRDVLALRDELRDHVLMVTASNVNSVHHTHIGRMFPEIFDGVHVVGASWMMGARKGDSDFWIRLLGIVNAHACMKEADPIRFDELVFVDDIAANLAEASTHGIHTVHFEHDHPHAVVRLRERLAQLGLPVARIAVANDAVGESRALSA